MDGIDSTGVRIPSTGAHSRGASSVISGILGRVARAGLSAAAIVWALGAQAAEVNWTAAAPGRVDRLAAVDFVGSELMFNLYDTLVMPSPDGKLQPLLAESWEGSGTSYT